MESEGRGPFRILTQTALGAVLGRAPLWASLVTAFAVGAFLDHTLWVLIHECAHNLLFRSASWNRIAAMAANLPHILPSAISFQTYHLKHHAYQGVYELDADLPNRWEARLVGHSAARPCGSCFSRSFRARGPRVSATSRFFLPGCS